MVALKGAGKHFGNRASQAVVEDVSYNFTYPAINKREKFTVRAVLDLHGDDAPEAVKCLADYDNITSDDPIGHYKVIFTVDGAEEINVAADNSLKNYFDFIEANPDVFYGKSILMQVKGPYEKDGKVMQGGIDEAAYIRADRTYRHLEGFDVAGPKLLAAKDGSFVSKFSTELYPYEYDVAFTTYREGNTNVDVKSRDHLERLGDMMGKMKTGLSQLPEDLEAEINEAAANTNVTLKNGAEFVTSCEDKKQNFLIENLGEDGLEMLRDIAQDVKNDDLEIVHGDILPGNVLVLENGDLVPLDFDNIGSTTRPENYDIGLTVSRFVLSHPDYKDAPVAEKAAAAKVILDKYNHKVEPEHRLTTDDLIKACASGLACKVMNNAGKADDPYTHKELAIHMGNFKNFMSFADELKVELNNVNDNTYAFDVAPAV